jgi:glycosyltransferase involved in cell wall biosynthesis
MCKPIKLSIIVPCYNEQDVLSETVKRLVQLINDLKIANKISSESFIVFVDDGSSDNTWSIIEKHHNSNSHIWGVKLASNVGHQNALLAGLQTALPFADAIVSIDADLQDDENSIREMVDYYTKGFDIVYGVRNSRITDTWFKRNTAHLFYKLMQLLGAKSVYNHADYRLMSRRAVAELMQYGERNLFLRGIVPLLGYKSTIVYYARSERFAGQTKYSLGKMFEFAINGITSFSVRPLRLILVLGLFFLFISLCILVYVMMAYFDNKIVPGWTSLMLSIWFCSGSILIGLGVVGEYLSKIYIEVKHRPLYNIESVLDSKIIL